MKIKVCGKKKKKKREIKNAYERETGLRWQTRRTSLTSLIKTTKLQPNAEQPSTKWTGNFQKDILLQKIKKPQQDGRRGNYMI